MGKISGKKFNRINIVAGICQGKWVAPRQYSGSTDSNLFEFWFENCLLAEIRGKYIVMDNATFHRKTRLTELAETKKCKIIWLPAYSPDLNPIGDCIKIRVNGNNRDSKEMEEKPQCTKKKKN